MQSERVMIFSDGQIALVVLIFVLLSSSHFVGSIFGKLDECIMRFCDVQGMLHLLRNIFVTFCMLQPLLFCSVYIWKHINLRAVQYVLISTLNVNQKQLWTQTQIAANDTEAATCSALNNTLNNTEHMQQFEQCNTGIAVSVNAVDYLFFCIPLAVVSCWSSMVWTQLSSAGVLHENQLYDTDLSERVAQYDGVYFLEILTLNVAGIATTAHGRSDIEIYYAVVACTLLMWNCMPMVYLERDSHSESVMALAFVLLVVLVMRNLWVHMIVSQCAGIVLVAVVHSVGVMMLCWLHCTANGQRQSSTIILLRTVASVALNMANLFVFAMGWDGVC